MKEKQSLQSHYWSHFENRLHHEWIFFLDPRKPGNTALDEEHCNSPLMLSRSKFLTRHFAALIGSSYQVQTLEDSGAETQKGSFPIKVV